jgi:hypothetical protein
MEQSASSAQQSATNMEGSPGEVPKTIHRIGGGSVANLRLKPAEEQLDPPGISLLKAASPREAAAEIKAAFPGAKQLWEAVKVVGSASEAAIRAAGFDVMPNRTRRLPNHQRLIHPAGIAGFSDENLTRLAQVFTDTVLE